MSFREKRAWITLITTILVYGSYFLHVGPRLLAGGAGVAGFIGPLVASIVVLIILQIALNVAAAIFDREGAREPRDERENLFELRADRAGFYTLQTATFCAIVSIFWWPDAATIANAVFLAMTLAEVARAGFTIAEFRRAAI